MEHFRDKDAITEQITDLLDEQGIFNPTDDSIVTTLVDNLSEPAVQLNELGQDIQRDMFASTANGTALDAHARNMTTERISGFYPYDLSKSNFKVYISNNKIASDITTDGKGIFIPEGTRILGAKFPFRTTEPIYISTDSNFGYGGIIGTEIDEEIIAAGSLTTLDLEIGIEIDNVDIASLGNENILCTNERSIQSGSFGESDDDLRNRMFLEGRSYHNRMIDTIKAIAYSIPGVVDINFYKNTHGVGTTSVIVLTQDPIVPDGIIEAVTVAIAELGDNSVRVMKPEYLVTVVYNKIEYNSDTVDTTNINELVASAQKGYINNLSNNTTLSLDTLRSVAINSSAEVKNIQITCLEINARKVSLTDQVSGWDEKFITAESEGTPAIKFV